MLRLVSVYVPFLILSIGFDFFLYVLVVAVVLMLSCCMYAGHLRCLWNEPSDGEMNI